MKKCVNKDCGYETTEDITKCVHCDGEMVEYIPEEVSEPNTIADDHFLVIVLSYLGSVISVGIGFYKMFAYDAGESYYSKPVNAYVGGDAYNFIINSNYAVAFFVLAVGLVIVGSTFVLVDAIKKNSDKTTK